VTPPPSTPAPGEIAVDRIDPNPEQPRRRFDEDALAALSDSIRQHGVLRPVVVRRAGDRYELLVGERRWRAARKAGLAAIPAVVADSPDRDRLELALIENVQRRDLNPIELAHAFRTLMETGKTQDEIGRRVSLDRSTVANHVRLLELPRELQEDVEEQRLTAGHARALLQVANPERRRHLRDKIVREQLSVRDAESLARPAGGRATARSGSRASRDPNLQRVIDALRQRLQTRVRIQGDASRGRVEIEYFGGEDLQRIAGILLGDA
jgi:ParB family chromosome partitioning protein